MPRVRPPAQESRASPAEGATPQGAGARGVLCTYGPESERRRVWLLWFDDPDRGYSLYRDEAEAMRAWDRAKDSWTCTLFATAEFVPARSNLGECPHCRRVFQDGETCLHGGCPMGGDF